MDIKAILKTEEMRAEAKMSWMKFYLNDLLVMRDYRAGLNLPSMTDLERITIVMEALEKTFTLPAEIEQYGRMDALITIYNLL